MWHRLVKVSGQFNKYAFSIRGSWYELKNVEKRDSEFEECHLLDPFFVLKGKGCFENRIGEHKGYTVALAARGAQHICIIKRLRTVHINL